MTMPDSFNRDPEADKAYIMQLIAEGLHTRVDQWALYWIAKAHGLTREAHELRGRLHAAELQLALERQRRCELALVLRTVLADGLLYPGTETRVRGVLAACASPHES
jgi:hypothetical protein